MSPSRSMSVPFTRAAVVASLLLACGESNLTVIDPGDGGPAGGGGMAGATVGGNGGTSGGNGGAAGSGVPPVSCGSVMCTGGQLCVNGACVCPSYQTLCNGQCIPTSMDPANCGACGTACTGNLACSGGICSPTCLPGLDKCGNACVDRKIDNNHCGACDNKCPAGQGCVNGQCAPGVSIGRPPANCAGGGPADGGTPGSGGCLGGMAKTIFRWALCSCKDVQFSAEYLTDGYDSTKGPYMPGGLGAGIGANENHGASGSGEVWGTLWIAGSGGITPSLAHTVKAEARAGGPLKSGGATFSVGKDAYAAGEVDGPVAIAGTLFMPASASLGSSVTYGSLMRQPVNVAPPCDFCAAQKVPIGAMVAARRPPNNDNAVVSLAANVYESPNGPLRLDLPCGQYYLTRIASSSHVTIVAHGRTALYVDGDINPDGLSLSVVPGGEFDVFVAGAIGTSGTLRIGSPNYPALTRVYVDGSSGVTISDDVAIAGNLYAPNGPVTYSSAAEQYGAVYAGNFSTSKRLLLHYDRAVINQGDKCPPPPVGPDGGPPPCGSCKDCGNQACINGTCGTCSTSAQCCPPLVCQAGRCGPDIPK